jgi:hypothetical protein
VKSTTRLLAEADKLMAGSDDRRWAELEKLALNRREKWRGAYMAHSRKLREIENARFDGRRLKKW